MLKLHTCEAHLLLTLHLLAHLHLYRIPGNFRIALFSQILQILLTRKIKFHEILPCHTFDVAMWIIHENILTKLLKSPFLQKFPGIW